VDLFTGKSNIIQQLVVSTILALYTNGK